MSHKRRKRDITTLARVEHDDERMEIARDRRDMMDDFADRLADRLDGRSTARWSGLAVGLGIVTAIGLAGVVIYLLVRKKDGKVVGEALGYNPMQAFPPITIVNQMPSMPSITDVAKVEKDKPSQNLPETVAQADYVNHDTSMRTVRLTTTQAFRVATAPSNNPWRVNLRTLGPPGTWAAYATDFSRLRPGSPAAEDVMVVPSGTDIVIRLNPRQILYGMSNADGVCASVVTSEYLPSAAPVLSVVR